MENFWIKLFDLNKIPTKVVLVIFLSSSLVLFLPDVFLAKLNLKDFFKEFGKYIGIFFVISLNFILVALFYYFAQKIKKFRIKKKIEKTILKRLINLGFHDKALLREFFIHCKDTLQLPVDDDTVVSLTNKGIIIQVSNTGFTYIHGSYLPFSLSKIARENLKLEMLDLPQDPTEVDKIRIMKARPNWAIGRSSFDQILNSYW